MGTQRNVPTEEPKALIWSGGREGPGSVNVTSARTIWWVSGLAYSEGARPSGSEKLIPFNVRIC